MDPLVVAQCPLDSLLAAIGRLTVPFAELPPGTEHIDRRVDGCPVYVGEVGGLAYLVEPDRTFLALCWGLLARVSREADALVIGVYYDRAEDHTEFFAARSGQVLRTFWNSPPKATRPYSVGEPLPSEAGTPLTSPDGVGLAVALASFGFPPFDCRRGFDSLPGERCVAWKGDWAALYESDAFGDPVKEHVRAYANPSYRPPEPVVRVRRLET
jgi:hypothetical protein